MTTRRTGYLVALVAAVLALVASIAFAFAFALGPGFGSTPAGDRDEQGGSRIMGGRSMMGGGSMMGGWGAGMWSGTGAAGPSHGWNGSGPVTVEQARAQAATWVSKYASGASLDAGVEMPMGYAFTATRNGQTIAMIMVNDDTGAVWGRLWAATGGTVPSGSPTPSATG